MPDPDRKEVSRTIPEMRKRTTPAIQIPEPPSSNQKRTRSFSDSKQTTRAFPDRTSVKNRSSKQREGPVKTSHLKNGSARKAISEPEGKPVGTPEVERSSTKVTRSIYEYFGSGGTQEAYRASSSAQQSVKTYTLERQCAQLSISSDDHAEPKCTKLCNDEEMSPPGTTPAEDSQGKELEETDDPDGAAILKIYQDDPEGVETMLPELIDNIIGRLPMLEVLRLQPELGLALRNAIHRPAFRRNRLSSEGEFSPNFFMTDDNGDLHWHGFDTKLRKWVRLPSLNFAPKIFPSPDPDLFKDYLMASDGGLLCVNVGKAPGRERLIICNPLTRMAKVLAPLKYARHPVLMHLKVDLDSGHYKVIVVGSATIGTEELSLKTEEYDSKTGVWECPEGSDLPCPPFGLNEYQNGAYFKDGKRELLMCVAIVDARGRGVLVYDMLKKRWAQEKQLHIPLVRSEIPNVSHLATTQIVECGGSVFVFSEQECGRDVYFMIHKLVPEVSGDFTWEEVMKRKRTGGRGLLVYPEFTCVPVSEHELGIFNSVEHTLEVIDLASPMEVTPLQYSSPAKGNRFHSLNAIGFVFKPSFKSVISPRGQTQCKSKTMIDSLPEGEPQTKNTELQTKNTEPAIVETEPQLTKEDSDDCDFEQLVDVDDDDHDHPISEDESEGDPVSTNMIDASGGFEVPIPESASATRGQIPRSASGANELAGSSACSPQSKSWEAKNMLDPNLNRFISAK